MARRAGRWAMPKPEKPQPPAEDSTADPPEVAPDPAEEDPTNPDGYASGVSKKD